MSTISAIILAHNEEKNIVDCINSIQCADEIIIVDDFSTDKTVEVAESLGARVICHSLDNDWSQQRRFAIEQSQYKWILFIDSDERISTELNHEIELVVKNGDLKSYWLQRYNVFHHHKATHGSMRPDKVLRLLPKKGATIEGAVHETITSPYPQATLKGPLYHYTYDNWKQYFNKFNKYTSIAAEKYYKEGKSCSFWKDIIFRPQWAFF